MEDEINATQSAIYSLIKEFIKRQHLVYDLLKAIRPDFLGTSDEDTTRPSKEYIRATQKGQWGENREWNYFIHGSGCSLIHAQTGEPIEWNVPELNRFDPYWFTNWIIWFVHQHPENSRVSVIGLQAGDDPDSTRRFIFECLDELQKHRFLQYYPDHTNMYELISVE